MTISTDNRHPAMDYAEHERTYSGFLTGAKISVGLIAVILILMAIYVA